MATGVASTFSGVIGASTIAHYGFYDLETHSYFYELTPEQHDVIRHQKETDGLMFATRKIFQVQEYLTTQSYSRTFTAQTPILGGCIIMFQNQGTDIVHGQAKETYEINFSSSDLGANGNPSPIQATHQYQSGGAIHFLPNIAQLYVQLNGESWPSQIGLV